MKTFTAAAAAAILAGVASAEDTAYIQCHGPAEPNWNQFEDMAARLYWKDSQTEVCVKGDECKNWHDDNLNIRVAFCSPYSDLSKEKCEKEKDLYNIIQGIRKKCEPVKAGGWIQVNEYKYIEISLNGEFTPSRVKSRATRGMPAPKRGLEAVHSKREEKFKIKELSTSIIKLDKRYQVGTPTPINGDQPGKITIEKGEEHSLSIGVSTEVSAGLEGVFSASIGMSMEDTFTTSWSQQQEYPLDCGKGQTATLFWYPYWDHYVGTFEPSGEKGDFWVPKGGEEGKFDVECSGGSKSE